MHALIVGARGVGKSTLIGRVLEQLEKPVYGFVTRKETHLEDEKLGCPVYIYEAGKPREQAAGNLVGHCLNNHYKNDISAFDRFAPKLRELAIKAEGGIIVMDEIGFMESGAADFCSAVMSLLDGSIPVIAAVKDKDFPFLNAVRSHHNCKCFRISPQNRDGLYHEVLDFMKKQT